MSYEILAKYYDALVKDDEATGEWVDWIESFAPGKDFLELACGSGEITRKLAENHKVDALDLSAQMVEEARNKDESSSIRFFVQDMRNLDGFGQYDAIGCFCDSFNYLLEEQDAADFFHTVSQHLKRGGLFLFDTHSLDRLEEFQPEYEEAGHFEDGTDVQWIIAAEDPYIYQDFAFYLNGRVLQEHHMQRVYDPQWLIEKLSEDFEVLSVKTDFDLEGIRPGEKYFLACRKKETT